MKRIFSLLTILFSFVGFNSCMMDCKSMNDAQLTLVFDISDKELFNEIRRDIDSNFGLFRERSHLGSVSDCERFTLGMVPISSSPALEISTASIGIDDPDAPTRKKRQLSDPTPLAEMMNAKLEAYKTRINDTATTNGSSIANVLLKTLVQLRAGTKNTILVFTDGVENSQYLNMYKRIPAASEMPALVNKLLDTMVLKKFREAQAVNMEINIIMVLKPSPARKRQEREVKAFWDAFFRELPLDNVQYIDNLTNYQNPEK